MNYASEPLGAPTSQRKPGRDGHQEQGALLLGREQRFIDGINKGRHGSLLSSSKSFSVTEG